MHMSHDIMPALLLFLGSQLKINIAQILFHLFQLSISDVKTKLLRGGMYSAFVIHQYHGYYVDITFSDFAR